MLALPACARAPAPFATRAGDLAITDVTVVPMDREGTLPHHTVVVRGDRIVAVAPAARITLDAGVTRIDGRGKWLLPGLADMHVHTWSERDLSMFVAAGVTTVRNMYGSDQHVVWRDELAKGTRFGPTLVTASPIVDGEPPVWPNSIVLTDPAKADAVVADIKAKRFDFVKPYSKLSPAAYDALAAAAARHGLRLEGHVPREVGLARALAAKQRSIEHLDGYLQMLLPADHTPTGDFWATMRAVVDHLDEARLPALVQQTAAAGTWNCPTLIVMHRMGGLDDVAAVERQTRWLHLVSPEVRATWDPKRDFRLASRTAADFATMRAANAVRGRIVRALADGGAPLLVGTDTGNPYVIPGEAMHDELELLVAAGVPRARALRAATADAGRFLGTGDGVIATGKRADLLLVGIDPLARPLPLVPDGVVLRGAWHDRAALEARLAALAAAPTTGRWQDVPALVPEGTAVRDAHYELRSGGKVVGEERLAVGQHEGGRVIVAQLVSDVPGRTVVRYRIAGAATSLAVQTSFGASIALTGQREGAELVATGTDAMGKPVRVRAPFPASAFFAAPGVGGSIELAAKLAGLGVGERRSATSLELAYFPAPAIETVTYDIARKPDADGHQVFAVTMRYATFTITGELVVDAHGLPVRQTLGAPLDLELVRVR